MLQVLMEELDDGCQSDDHRFPSDCQSTTTAKSSSSCDIWSNYFRFAPRLARLATMPIDSRAQTSILSSSAAGWSKDGDDSFSVTKTDEPIIEMKFELNDSTAAQATTGLEWGQFVCPACQTGRYLSQGAFRKIYTVDQRSCDKFRRHLLVDHSVANHDERVRIVEFFRRSAIETTNLRRSVPKDTFANSFPFYSSCILCDKTKPHQHPHEDTVFATCHQSLEHLTSFHSLADVKSIMHVFNACRGLWSALKQLPKRMRVLEGGVTETADLLPPHVFHCPFCQPKNKKYQAGTLELHLFNHHWVRNVHFLDALLIARRDSRNNNSQAVVSIAAPRGSISIELEPPISFVPEMHLSKPQQQAQPHEVVSANFDECPDSPLYWYLPDLPATLRLMPSHRQLCQQFLQSVQGLTNTLAFVCKGCPRDSQPQFGDDKTPPVSSLLKHLEKLHRIECGYHLMLFSMQKRSRIRDLQLAYFTIGHHVLDFQAFFNPHALKNYSQRFLKGIPNRTSYCPFCCIFGATSALPTPKESSSALASHFTSDHSFRDKRFARELADLLFGKTMHIEIPPELI